MRTIEASQDVRAISTARKHRPPIKMPISFPIMQELRTVEAQTLKGLPMPAQGRAERDTVGSKPAILPGEVGPDIQNVQI